MSSKDTAPSPSPSTATRQSRRHPGRRTGGERHPGHGHAAAPPGTEGKRWFLLRAITDVPHTFRFASAAPWYAGIGGKPIPPRRTAPEFFLAWTRDRAAAIGKAITDDAKRTEVLAEWKKAEDFWQLRASAK